MFRKNPNNKLTGINCPHPDSNFHHGSVMVLHPWIRIPDVVLAITPKRGSGGPIFYMQLQQTTLTRLKLLFDLIVVDAPPLLPVSDPAVLSREVDGVAMVVRAGRTQRWPF